MNPIHNKPSEFTSPLLGGPTKSGKTEVLTQSKDELQTKTRAKFGEIIGKPISWVASKVMERKFNKMASKQLNLDSYKLNRRDQDTKEVAQNEAELSQIQQKLSKSIDKLAKLPGVQKLVREQRIKMALFQAQHDIATFHAEIKAFQKKVSPNADFKYLDLLKEKFAIADSQINKITQEINPEHADLAKELKESLENAKKDLDTLEDAAKAAIVQRPEEERIEIDLDKVLEVETQIKSLEREVQMLSTPEEDEIEEFKELRENTLKDLQEQLKVKKDELRKLEGR